MKAIGYTIRPGGRFVREASTNDVFKTVRAGTERTLVGMGASAYSHAWGYFFRNCPSERSANGLGEYIKRVSKEGFAIDKGMELDEVELTAGRLVSGIRSELNLPAASEKAEAYIQQATKTLAALEELGLVDRSAGGGRIH